MTYRPGPDFVCIGAQKAGTTWLFDNLEVQAGVWMPPEKELHYFNRVCPNEELVGVEARAHPIEVVELLLRRHPHPGLDLEVVEEPGGACLLRTDTHEIGPRSVRHRGVPPVLVVSWSTMGRRSRQRRATTNGVLTRGAPEGDVPRYTEPGAGGSRHAWRENSAVGPSASPCFTAPSTRIYTFRNARRLSATLPGRIARPHDTPAAALAARKP